MNQTPPRARPTPPEEFDARYELLERLGQGGFALVYRAVQRSTGQQVAVKVLRQASGLPDDERQEREARFRREMRVLAQIRHPNVVRLIDAGTWSTGRMYLVTELVDGQTLHRVVDGRGPMPLAEVRPWMLQVLDALSAAHARGLIHRDIKPPNIMISPGGLAPRATLLDFGVATVTRAHRTEAFETLTVAGTVIGTPAYLAPELVRGEPATPRSDLYAWGLVLLECLTGRSLYGGKPLREVLPPLLSDAPTPIPAELAPTSVGALLAAALDKDPTRRASSAAELYQRLEQADDAIPLLPTTGALLPPERSTLASLIDGPDER